MSEFSLGWFLTTTSIDNKIKSIDLAETKDELWPFIIKKKSEGCQAGIESIEQIKQYLDNNKEVVLSDIEVSGTEFQKNVWSEIRKVPSGGTRTYQDIADLLGKPSAVRAVASAVGANQLAVLIPCHRVIPKSGGLGKFRWGSAMKDKLLKREKI